MIKKFKYILKKLITIKIIGKSLDKFLYPFFTFYQINHYLNFVEKTDLGKEYTKALSILKESLTVRNGCFKGMKYSNFKSIGSTIAPKLLGSYEHELSETIKKILKKDYSTIVDVGCAEGYYAVGLARAFKIKEREVSVYAFDTDKNAQILCKENSLKNSLNISVAGFCSRENLLRLCKDKYSLIFIDTEGYELELINKNLTRDLKHCDFLIESHDCIDINTTAHILSCFKETHEINIIFSKDDILKAYEYDFPEIKNLTLNTKFELLKEQRSSIMRWIYATKLV